MTALTVFPGHVAVGGFAHLPLLSYFVYNVLPSCMVCIAWVPVAGRLWLPWIPGWLQDDEEPAS